MVVIRLARFGRTNAPHYRITVADQRFAATSRFIEVLGTFNPKAKTKAAELVLDLPKAQAWVAKGAKPTQRVRSLMRQAGATKA
jgi:small subunit ribosomal protein S16